MVEQALKLAQNFLFEKYYIFHAREDSQREMSLLFIYPNKNDTNLFHIYCIVLSKDLNCHLINLFGDKELSKKWDSKKMSSKIWSMSAIVSTNSLLRLREKCIK